MTYRLLGGAAPRRGTRLLGRCRAGARLRRAGRGARARGRRGARAARVSDSL